MNIILASASPRRKELLSLITEDFSVVPSLFDEEGATADTPKELALLLACKKAESILFGPDDLVIGCDTVVAAPGGGVFGKPDCEEHAREMLRALSGHTHAVYTGVCVLYRGKKRTFAERTDVTFYPLTDEEIDAYIRTGEPFDKAGAYGIQGGARLFVKAIRGDYSNVVGLPAARLYRVLREFGV